MNPGGTVPRSTRPLSLAVAALTAAWLAVAAARDARAARAATLDSHERRIVAAVDRGVPAALALLERAVSINSGTQNLEGVRAVGRLFKPEFEALGFQAHGVDGTAWGRAGHLVAERRGREGALRVLLIGHLDTVFESSSPFQAWEALGDTAARGPGSTDMKGGDVVMLLALAALKEAGRLEDLDVTVILTGDEENAGRPYELSRAELFDAARRADVVLGFEDGDGDPHTAVAARRGSSAWRLGVWARPAHSSQVFQPEVGEGAILTAARMLRAFRDSLAREDLLTFNPGAIIGGTEVAWNAGESRGSAFGKSNVVAESTFVSGDLRALSVAQRERAKNVMRAIVADTGPNARATIEFDDGYPPYAPEPGNLWLLEQFDAVSRDLGAGPVALANPRDAGAADISFTQGLAPMGPRRPRADGLGRAHGARNRRPAHASAQRQACRRAALTPRPGAAPARARAALTSPESAGPRGVTPRGPVRSRWRRVRPRRGEPVSRVRPPAARHRRAWWRA
jgi:glutamate carboxypeptidase